VLCAQQLGIIDEHGNLLSKEWPPARLVRRWIWMTTIGGYGPRSAAQNSAGINLLQRQTMATKATVSDIHPVSEELKDFRALQARLLAGAAERIHADIERAIELGMIDEQGSRLWKEWPPDMQPGAQRT